MVLEAVDVDTPPDRVFFFISAAPRFGKLLLKVTCVSVPQQKQLQVLLAWSDPNGSRLLQPLGTQNFFSMKIQSGNMSRVLFGLRFPPSVSADRDQLDRAVSGSELHAGAGGDEPTVVPTQNQQYRVQRSRQLPLRPERRGPGVSEWDLLHLHPLRGPRSEPEPEPIYLFL